MGKTELLRVFAMLINTDDLLFGLRERLQESLSSVLEQQNENLFNLWQQNDDDCNYIYN